MKDATVLYDLIHEARQAYIESQGEKISIFSPDQLSYFEEEDQICLLT